MENLELLSFDELREKISEMEEVLKILNSDADIATKNYLLIERILSKNNFEIERKYDYETDVLELGIRYLGIKMRRNVSIDNFTKMVDGEMSVLTYIYNTLKDMNIILHDRVIYVGTDVDYPIHRNNFIKTYRIINRIICPNHCEIASNITIYILDSIFGIGNDIFFTKPNASYRFVMLSNNYCCLKYHVNKSPYTLIEDIPYSFLKFILKKVIIKKRIILSRALCKKIHVKYFETNDITPLIENRDIIKLYNKNNNVIATFTLDDSEYKRVCVLFMDSFPKTYEFLDAVSLFMKGIEYEFNRYLKDVE